MANVYQYRVLKSSWGIAIDVTAEVSACVAGAQLVTEDLYLYAEASLRLSLEEQAHLAHGLRLVAEKIRAQSLPYMPIVVRVLALEFNFCDYQPEGLVCALAGWVAQEYGFTPPSVQVTFDRRSNRYRFDFTDGI